MLPCISYFRNLYIKMSFLKNKNYPAMPQQLNSDSSELRGADKLNFSALIVNASDGDNSSMVC